MSEADLSREELEAELTRLRAEHGEWSDDIPLPHGVWTRGNLGVPHTRLKRIIQVLQDVIPTPVAQCRILALGRPDGLLCFELGLAGAEVVAVGVRPAEVERAEFCRRALSLDRVEVREDDLRNLSRVSYGDFDAVVCSEPALHLDTPDLFHLLEAVQTISRRAAVIDTHMSLTPRARVWHQGAEYRGHHGRHGFLLTRPSLVNALSRAGFHSVYECFQPAHINFGQPGLESENRCTFVALTGDRCEVRTSPAANGLEEDWPEGALAYPVDEPPNPLELLREQVRRMGSSVLRRLGGE